MRLARVGDKTINLDALLYVRHGPHGLTLVFGHGAPGMALPYTAEVEAFEKWMLAASDRFAGED